MITYNKVYVYNIYHYDIKRSWITIITICGQLIIKTGVILATQSDYHDHETQRQHQQIREE